MQLNSGVVSQACWTRKKELMRPDGSVNVTTVHSKYLADNVVKAGVIVSGLYAYFQIPHLKLDSEQVK